MSDWNVPEHSASDLSKVSTAGESIVRKPMGGTDCKALAAFSREVAEAIPAW